MSTKTPQEKKRFAHLSAQIAQLVDQKLALEQEVTRQQVIAEELATSSAKLLTLIHKMTHRYTYEEFEAYTNEVDAEFEARHKAREGAKETPSPAETPAEP